MKNTKLLTFINNMTKEKFHEAFVKGVGLSSEFSSFATDPDFVSEGEKINLRRAFVKAGIPSEYLSTDDDLYAATKIIMARAVKIL